MRLNLRLSHKGLVLIAVPLAFELFTFAWLYTALLGAEQEIRREAYAKDVQRHMNNMTQLIVGASTALVYYCTTANQSFLARYKRSKAELALDFKELTELQKDKPGELAALKPLHEASDRAVMYMDEARRALEMGDESRKTEFILNWRNLLGHLFDEIDKVSLHCKSIAETAPELEEYRRVILKQLVLLAIFASIGLAAGLALYFNRDTARRLRVLMENTQRFAKGEPLARTLEGSDEIGELDQVFHQMADTITEQARQKQEFVAMITHDMRSPLTAVVGALAMLTEGIHGDRIAGRNLEIVERCETSLQRIVRLINDLLDAEKIAAGKMEIHCDTLALSSVFDSAVQTVQPLAEEKKVSFVVPAVSNMVYADGDRMVQVMVNLFSNAIKFSPSGGKITAAVQERDCSVEVRISDEGPGIPESDLAIIFQRFQQSKSTSARIKGGTGLGLAVCKDIIELHKGTIGVESRLGQGSTFWFCLPITKGAMEKAASSGTAS